MDTPIITPPKIEISADILNALQEFTCEESQVVIHCIYNSCSRPGMRIRVQPSTYLYDENSSHRSELVHVENIVLAPKWQNVSESGEAYFSLVFSGLPKSCTVFDLIEVNEACPFRATGIARNEEDVYFICLR